MLKKNSENYSLIGIHNSFDIDLEDVLKDKHLPFSYLIDENIDSYLYDEIDRKREIIENNRIVPINEATRKQILTMADKARIARAKKMTTVYNGVRKTSGLIQFTTNSQTLRYKKYTQLIKLKEAKDMKAFKEFKERDIVRLFLSGDLQVNCTCKDFKYRYKYLAWHKGFGLYNEKRFPSIRNNQLKGSICKHLIVVLTVINNNWMKIARDMTKTPYFRNMMD